MEPITLLIIIAIAIVGFFFIWKITKFIFRLIIIAAVIGGIYYFWSGGTMKSLSHKALTYILGDLENLKDIKTFCSGEAKDQPRCLCILEPVYDDINDRLSWNEIKKLNGNKEALMKEIKQSLLNKKDMISQCLLENKGFKYADKVRELLKNLQKE